MGFVKSKFSALKKNHFLKNVAVLCGGTTIAQLLSIVTLPIIGRLYNENAMGVFTVYSAIINITQQIACFRYDYAIVVADDDDEAGGAFLLSCILAVFFSAALALVTLPLIPQISGFLNIPGEVLWTIPITTLITGTTTAVNYFNVRHERYKTITSATIIKSVAQVALQIGLYFIGFGYWGLVLGQLFSNLFGNLRMFMTLKGRIHRYMFKVDFLLRIARKNSNYPKFMLPSGLANSLTLNIMPMTISAAYVNAQAGYYGMVNRALGLPLTLVSNSVSQVFLKQAASDKNDRKHLEKTFTNVAKWLLILAIIPFGILFFFGNWIIPFVLGSTWVGAARLLKYLIPLYVVRFVVTPLTSSAIALGKQKATMIWQFCLLGTVAIPALAAIIFKEDFPFTLYLLSSAILMSIAYLVFYRFCLNVVRGKDKDEKSPDENKEENQSEEGADEEAISVCAEAVSTEAFSEQINPQGKGADTMGDSQQRPKGGAHSQITSNGGWFIRMCRYLKNNKPFDIALVILIAALIALSVFVAQSIGKSTPKASETDYTHATELQFKDPVFEQIIRNELKKQSGPIYNWNLESISTLTIEDVLLTNIDELQYCTGLTELTITNCGLKDVSVIGNLTRLKKLDLTGNPIQDNKPEDLDFLKNLTNLTDLTLATCRLKDMPPIYDLPLLSNVNLATNYISDKVPENEGRPITAEIQKLTNLQELNLNTNQIEDMSIFSNMPSLMKLQLTNNSITKVVPLENMAHLEELSLQGNKVLTIETLGEMPVLNKLNVIGTGIDNISFITQYPTVTSLNINENAKISSIEPLRNHTALEALNIVGTRVQDLEPLHGLTKHHFNTIYLDENFDRTKMEFMLEINPITKRDSFGWGDLTTRKYVLDKKHKDEVASAAVGEQSSDTNSDSPNDNNG